MNFQDLHQEQKACINWMLNQRVGCITPECGSGKTVMGLTAFLATKRMGQADTMLVVSVPKGIKETWAHEHKRWEHLQSLDVVALIGTPEQRKKILETHHDVICVSYNLLDWLYDYCYYNNKPIFTFVFADEGSCLKGYNSKWRKTLIKLSTKAQWRIIATATPTPHDAMDYWGLMKYLDGGQSLCATTITTFRDLYCRAIPLPGKFGSRYEIRDKRAVEDIERLVEPFFYTFTLGKEVPIETITVEREFSPEGKAIYDQVVQDQCINSIVFAATGQPLYQESLDALQLSNKLAQIANGFVYVDESLRLSDTTLERIGALELAKLASTRVRRAVELFTDRLLEFRHMVFEIKRKHPDSNIAVAYAFKHDLEMLKRAFPEGVDDSEENVAERWNAGEIPMLFLQYARSSKSLNLQGGGYVLAVYSATFNWEHDYQVARRLARQGQKHPLVYVYRLKIKGTVDEDKEEALGKRGFNHRQFQEKIAFRVRRLYDKQSSIKP